MHIRRHEDHNYSLFFKRTIAAQIHLVGSFAAVIGMIVLLSLTLENPNNQHFWACLVFGVAGVLMFGSSTIYHFLDDGFQISPALERWLRNFDHFSIYVFIAATYTPFLVNVVAAPWKNILLILIWSIAFLGIIYVHYKPRLPYWAQHRMVYTTLFVFMGWTVVFRIEEVLNFLSPHNFRLLLFGGLSYTIGAVIYAIKRPKLFAPVFGFHEIWHIMVMIGYGFHYFLILNFYR